MAPFGFGRSGPGSSRSGPFGWARVGRPVDLVMALGLIGLLALAAAALQLRLGPNRSLSGMAAAIDGDSIRLVGEELRLAGLDAPELRQSCATQTGEAIACGRLARAALATRLAAAPVTCAVGETDRYGRGLARCRQGEIDLNAALVREGQAVAYGDYRAEEAAARAAGRGLWALSFERPEAWRRQAR